MGGVLIPLGLYHGPCHINALTGKGLGRVEGTKVYIGNRGKESATMKTVQQRNAVQVATTIKRSLRVTSGAMLPLSA